MEKKTDVRTTSAYFEGLADYWKGVTDTECPYKDGNQRRAWFTGWLDARTNDNLGHIFKKYKLKHP